MQAPHAPVEVDISYRAIYRDEISDKTRLKVAGMISAMDDAIGEIVTTLKDEGLYENSIILFSSGI